MSISEPYPDERQETRRNTVDWLVTVRGNATIQTFRFGNEEAAWTFYNDHKDETPDEEPGVRG